MKNGFKNPIAIKDEKKTMKSPWSFDQPKYDERSGRFINAGSHYGVGHTQPVGHHGDPKFDADTLPRKHAKVHTLTTDDVPHGNLPVDFML